MEAAGLRFGVPVQYRHEDYQVAGRTIAEGSGGARKTVVLHLRHLESGELCLADCRGVTLSEPGSAGPPPRGGARHAK